MEKIDRYIYAAVGHLPGDVREDAKRELYSNIQGMLPENPTEDQVHEVLKKLGNPKSHTDRYRPGKRYLIGPGRYKSYIFVLTSVTGILALVPALAALIDWAFKAPAAKSSGQLLRTLLSSVLEGAMQGAVWVTLVFAVLERSGVFEGKIPFIKKKWTPDKLPRVPVNNRKPISRVETFFEMFFAMSLAAVICFYPQVIGIYTKGNTAVPILNLERLKYYTVIIAAAATIQLGILIWKTVVPFWSIPLAAANAFHNVMVFVLMLAMVSDKYLINSGFLVKLTSLTDLTLSQVTLMWQRGTYIFAAIFIAVTICDSMVGVFKCKNQL